MTSIKPVRRRMSLLLLSSGVAALFSPRSAIGKDGTPSLTKKEVRALIASAKTSEDHSRIAGYYHGEAVNFTAKQKEHEEDLEEYNKNSSRYPSKYPNMGDHCRQLAGFYKLAARKAQDLADMHDELAKQTEK